MGNLHKRNGVFYADYIDRSGKRQQPSLRTRDPVVARTRLRDLELATTDRAPQKTEALDVALSYFIDVTCAAKPAATVRCYRQKAGHLSRLLGDLLLDSLSRENVERFIAIRLGEDAAKHTIHKELVVLRGALKAAEARDRFHHGVHNVVPRFDAEYEPRRTYLTPEQFMRLTDNLLRPIGTGASEAQRTRWEARRVRRTFYVLFMALASERLGEVEQMDWRNVDLHRNVIVVPDGKTGSRVVRIHPVLRLWIERYQQEAGPITEGWTNIGRDLPAACARAGVPRCTANDLRRTFASWLVQSGETYQNCSATRVPAWSSSSMASLTRRRCLARSIAYLVGRTPVTQTGCQTVALEALLAQRRVRQRCETPSIPASFRRVMKCPGTELNRRHADFQSLCPMMLSPCGHE
jgi:integrase